ncbi:phosphoenolpyruvate carboxylase [Vibrio lentus]|nr:phosphoenolpyruvate carboxylase [Vibrio lentus]
MSSHQRVCVEEKLHLLPSSDFSELELGKIASFPPAKRNPNGGVESLRAIPRIPWSQNRFCTSSALLGAGEAIQYSVDQGHQAPLEEMCREWPFFSTRFKYAGMRAYCSKIWKSLGTTINALLIKNCCRCELL